MKFPFNTLPENECVGEGFLGWGVAVLVRKHAILLQVAFCLGWMLAYLLAMKLIDRRWASVRGLKRAQS